MSLFLLFGDKVFGKRHHAAKFAILTIFGLQTVFILPTESQDRSQENV